MPNKSVILRSALLSSAIIIALLTGCGGGGGGSVQETVVTPPKDTAGPTISKLSAEVNANYTQATIKATVTDTASGVKSVTAKITPPVGTSTTIALVAGSADEYSASFSIPENTSPEPASYSVDLTAVDKSDNSTVRKITFSVPGKTQEPADTTAPAITGQSATYNPQAKSATVYASVTDVGGVKSVTASVASSNYNVETALSYNPSTKRYQGTLSAVPQNTAEQDKVYTVRFLAADSAGNSSSAEANLTVPGVIPIPADKTPPVLSEALAVYDSVSKSATLSTKAQDSGSGIKSVKAVINLPAGGTKEIELVYDPVSSTYSAVYSNVPKNWSFEPKVYVLDFIALDKAGNSASKQTSFSVNGIDVPPPPSQ